jgi:hypothetical protein
MTSRSGDEQLWVDFCTAETSFYDARMALIGHVQDLPNIINKALPVPSQRGSALRILEILPEERSRQHLQQLVDLASIGHSDIELCRSVILRIDREWLVENIDSHVSRILDESGEEEFRRIAELYKLLDSRLLKIHLERCANHMDAEIKEIASDFTSNTSTTERPE